MRNLTNENYPIIAGVEITTDSEGRFNLNALHKASGEGEHKRPSKWLATIQAKELIAELEANLLKNNQSPNSGSAHKVVNAVNGGSPPGTFAHELLAYAGWIAPKFRLMVNQTFLDYKTGRLAHVTQQQTG
nr:KilA-N domain-containing protein [Arsenophonus endosymbiont of Aleurodicus floccissimus]